jgi:membrane protein YdbS with pleckstrin-like domain
MENMKRIDPRSAKARRAEGWAAFAVCLAVAAGLFWLANRFDWPAWIPVSAAGLAGAISVWDVIVAPGAMYRSWRYRVAEKEIELHHGLWSRYRTIVPMSRIQHVHSKQGPIQKQYGLATVTFSTAAGSHHIPGISEEEAERVRKQIAEWAGVADADR